MTSTTRIKRTFHFVLADFNRLLEVDSAVLAFACTPPLMSLPMPWTPWAVVAQLVLVGTLKPLSTILIRAGSLPPATS